MKWFKHYSDASDSAALSELKRKFGFEGLGRYWTLIEYLQSRWASAEVEPIFEVQQEKLRDILKFRSWNGLRLFVDHLTTIPGILAEQKGNVYEIKANILLKLLHSDFKKSGGRPDKMPPKSKSKSKSKNNILSDPIKLAHKKEEEKEKDFVGQLEEIYKLAYPLKKGKEKGLRLISKQVTNESDLEKFRAAVNNYAEICKTTDPKFIKHFSTFCNGDWRDYIEATAQTQTPLTNEQKTRKVISEFIKQAEANRA